MAESLTEDRPRLTREELAAITDRFKREECNEFANGRCYTRACLVRGGWTSGPTEGFTPMCEAKKVIMACELAQRTVAAEAERHASIARFQELSLIDQERAEQAERTLAEIHGILDGPVYDATQAIYELRRLLLPAGSTDPLLRAAHVLHDQGGQTEET